MWIKIVFSVVCITLAIFLITYNTDEKIVVVSNRGVELNFENAPKLDNIFANNPNDPHQKYTSNDACLVCHLNGATIPNYGISPKMNHRNLNNCSLCHKLK
tara:strand:- start:22 stop:324 length:303 start_codon:yes stop_codon:yes gene_type:complete